MQTFLQVLASSAALVATSMFFIFLARNVTRMYAEGLQRINDYVVDLEEKDEKEGTSLVTLGRTGSVVFLPLVESLRDSDRLGVPMALAKWEFRIVQAGLRGRLTAEQFMGMCFVAATAGAGLLLTLSLMAGMGLMAAVIIGGGVGAFFGFVAPIMVLNNLAFERVSHIEKRLPYAIEFMLLSMEASAALPEAMAVYCNMMPEDPLADEFKAALRDIARGLSQSEAMKAMGERIASDSVSAFLLAVNIGLDTGQPIKDVFQKQADATRRRRFQAAEEIAKTAGTKAILPLMIVMIGVLMLTVGPMAIMALQGGLM